MAELVVFGVPKGWDISDCNHETANFLELFYTTWKPGIEFQTIRRNNKMFYIMLVHENPGAKFFDANGRAGSFFGMALIYENKYVANVNQVRDLLQATYDNYVKGRIIEELPNGSRRYKISQLSMPGDKVGWHVINGMDAILRANPEFKKSFVADIKPLPPIQNQMQRD